MGKASEVTEAGVQWSKARARTGTEQPKHRVLGDPEEARLGAGRSVRVGCGVPATATCV